MECLQKPLSSFHTVRGIQKHEITGLCQDFPDPGEAFGNLDPENPGSVRQFAPFQVFLNGAHTIGAVVAEQGVPGPSTQGLDSKSSTPGEGIQDNGPRYRVPKNRKKGLPDLVQSRSDILARWDA